MKLKTELFDPSRLTEADIQAFRAKFRDNIAAFADEVLGIELDDNQVDIANAVRDEKRIAVVSGKGIGKSFVEGVLALWFYVSFPGAKVRMLANTDDQSLNVMWRPMLEMVDNSAFRAWFDPTNSKDVHIVNAPNGPSIHRMTWSENSVENVAGVHADHLLYIMDEASKLPSELIEGIVGGLSGKDNRVLLCGNGTRSSGYFYNRCQEGSGWKVLKIDARRSRWTNLDAINAYIEEHGLDSDAVRINVLGEFPRLGGQTIVPDAQIVAAMHRKLEPTKGSSAIVCGMDVGGGGDPTVWVVRDGLRIVAIEQNTSAGANEDELIRLTASVCQRYGVARLLVDSTGLGHFLPGRLRKALPGVEVIGRNFGEKSPDDAHANMRAWAFFRMRAWFALGVSIGNRQDLREEILAIEYRTNQSGKLALQPKDSVKAIIGRSPNIADALALSCAYPGDLATLGIPLHKPSKTSFTKLLQYQRWG